MKFLNFSAIFGQKVLWLILALATFSCASKPVDQNKLFDERYGQDVEKIKIQRRDPATVEKLDAKTPKLDFTAPLEMNEAHYTNNNVTIPEYYTPQQFANQPLSSQPFQAPAEMFENNYNPTIGVPFRKIGAEFDVINIPPQDAYGVRAGMSEKEYLLVSRKLLQQNIDQINAQRSQDDIDNSTTLIAEQRKLKRKAKMIKIFGQESVTVEDELKSSGASKEGEESVKKKVVNKSKTTKEKSTEKLNIVARTVIQKDAPTKNNAAVPNNVAAPQAAVAAVPQAMNTTSTTPNADLPAIPIPAIPAN